MAVVLDLVGLPARLSIRVVMAWSASASMPVASP
jgi:hypothetical protein